MDITYTDKVDKEVGLLQTLAKEVETKFVVALPVEDKVQIVLINRDDN